MPYIFFKLNKRKLLSMNKSSLSKRDFTRRKLLLLAVISLQQMVVYSKSIFTEQQRTTSLTRLALVVNNNVTLWISRDHTHQWAPQTRPRSILPQMQISYKTPLLMLLQNFRLMLLVQLVFWSLLILFKDSLNQLLLSQSSRSHKMLIMLKSQLLPH